MTVPMKDWLVVARDEQMHGFRVLQVRAQHIKSAYDKVTRTFVMKGWGLPENMSAVEIYDLSEQASSQGKLLFRIFDTRKRPGLFNGTYQQVKQEPEAAPDYPPAS